MPYRENSPTYNVNRKVYNFKDFLSDEEGEKQELKKVRRGFLKNSEIQQIPGETKTKYNKVTHKNDELTSAMVDDKIDAIEEIEENLITESKIDDLKKKKKSLMDEMGEIAKEKRKLEKKWDSLVSEIHFIEDRIDKEKKKK